MNNYLEFTIKKGLFYEKDVFRFYCDHSHMHGFRHEPPKTFKEVYKVYYKWGVFRIHNNKKEEALFELYDEGSALLYLSDVLREVLEQNTLLCPSVRVSSSGQPASEWEIINYVIDDEAPEKEYIYKINVEENWANTAYNMYFKADQLLEFTEYIDSINQYMLEHSEGI